MHGLLEFLSLPQLYTCSYIVVSRDCYRELEIRDGKCFNLLFVCYFGNPF